MSNAMQDWKDLGRLLTGQGPKGRGDAETAGDPRLGQMLDGLAALPMQSFYAAAFATEPLAGRITPAQQAEWTREAEGCGLALAAELAGRYPGFSPAALAASLGLPVERSEKQQDTLLPIFAQYHTAGKITLYAAHARAAQRLADEAGFAVDVEAVLLAHELFHHMEEQNAETTFTRGRHLRLGRGPFARSAGVGCLSEIGAAAFAGRLLGLAFPAGALDVLLLYTVSPAEARSLYRYLTGLHARSAEKETTAC